MSLANQIRLKNLIKDLSDFMVIRDLDVVIKETSIEFWFSFSEGDFEQAKSYIDSLHLPDNIDIILVEET